MQLQSDLWIEGAYYMDFDSLGQLRIVGPNNHLHFAGVGLYRDKIRISEVYTEKGELVVKGHFMANKLFFHDPVVAHIQKVRHYIERPGQAPPTFEKVVSKHPMELAPNYIAANQTKAGYELIFKRLYQRHWYGVKVVVPPEVKVRRVESRRGFALEIKSAAQIPFQIVTDADTRPEGHLGNIVKPDPIKTTAFKTDKSNIDRLLDRTAIEITHLVRNNKTSGFDYGTVFPRDWMESADLGSLDLETDAIAHMYHKAFEYVNPQGVGWHENIVGEFQFEKQQESNELATSLDDLIDRSSRIGAALKELISQVEQMYVIRNMVDIEPRYILSLDRLLPPQLPAIDIDRVRRVARYILLQAEINDLISFKKMPALLRRHKHDEYYAAGNWRDSEHAFKMVHPVIAPYDVNVVFYPKALEVIEKNAELLQADPKHVKALREKWNRVKDWYRFKNQDGSTAFALALYDIKKVGDGIEYKKLEVNHLDEAYESFYGHPDEADVVSLAKRLLDHRYFYTPSGPLVVGADDEGYDTTNYHGKVIWTKQTAFVIAGLERQLKAAKQRKWSHATQELIEMAIHRTSQASINAWITMGAIPELHYDLSGEPHFYNDQPTAEGPMNKVQLWSAVGARRIIRTYLEVARHGKRLSRVGKR